ESSRFLRPERRLGRREGLQRTTSARPVPHARCRQSRRNAMNIFGHENQGASHVNDEEERVPAGAAPGGADEQILAALARGERNLAAGLLVTAHAPSIGRACMALLGQQSDAEDALQETLMAALDGLEQFRGDGTLRAWLLSVARRRCARR